MQLELELLLRITIHGITIDLHMLYNIACYYNVAGVTHKSDIIALMEYRSPKDNTILQ